MAHVPRIYWPEELVAGQNLTIDGDRAHHLLRVLKRGKGDEVLLFTSPDREYPARIMATGKQQLQLHIDELRQVRRESPLRSVLVQAIARGDRMDYSVQKAVELGVWAIQPVLSQYGGVQLDARRLTRKQTHWQAIAMAAAEQSGRTQVPPVRDCLRLQDWLGQTPRHGFVLAPGANGDWPSAPAPEQEVCILVGPEGGLSETELQLARQGGLMPLSLGPRILRTETAGVVALSALQLRWGDF